MCFIFCISTRNKFWSMTTSTSSSTITARVWMRVTRHCFSWIRQPFLRVPVSQQSGASASAAMHLKKCVPSLTKTRYLSFFWPSRVAASLTSNAWRMGRYSRPCFPCVSSTMAAMAAAVATGSGLRPGGMAREGLGSGLPRGRRRALCARAGAELCESLVSGAALRGRPLFQARALARREACVQALASGGCPGAGGCRARL